VVSAEVNRFVRHFSSTNVAAAHAATAAAVAAKLRQHLLLIFFSRGVIHTFQIQQKSISSPL
jgi:hypothetical protein